MDFNDMNAKINAWFTELIDTLKSLPTDEKISYGSISFGVVLLIFAAILW